MEGDDSRPSVLPGRLDRGDDGFDRHAARSNYLSVDHEILVEQKVKMIARRLPFRKRHGCRSASESAYLLSRSNRRRSAFTGSGTAGPLMVYDAATIGLGRLARVPGRRPGYASVRVIDDGIAVLCRGLRRRPAIDGVVDHRLGLGLERIDLACRRASLAGWAKTSAAGRNGNPAGRGTCR